jgi:hypothetical protein
MELLVLQHLVPLQQPEFFLPFEVGELRLSMLFLLFAFILVSMELLVLVLLVWEQLLVL